MKTIFAALALGTMIAVPFTAAAQQSMSGQELVAYAIKRNACGTGKVSSASYDPAESGKILVSCTTGGYLEGEFPAAGAVAAGVTVVALAIAASSGGSTSDTQ